MSLLKSILLMLAVCASTAHASSHYAAIVVDADSGRVIHEIDSTQRWYPASLTKVMTLYMTFMALESGRLQLDEVLTASSHAASQPKSRLGLRTGQSIRVEQAIQAVATRSANDAAVLLAERIGGTESYFAQMMTDQAQRIGMYNSSFRNASGLPDEGQISSARDLALLANTVIHQFPQYYRYFSAQEILYQGRMLPSTNRLLKSYPEADGMKTGFTCGSGYNLIASAKRNGHRIIGVLLGGHSSAERFVEMEHLLDLGFERSSLGQEGMAITQLRDHNYAPPPYQLSSNRCAGSEAHMGEQPVLAKLIHHHASKVRSKMQGKSGHAVSHKLHTASSKKTLVVSKGKAGRTTIVSKKQPAHSPATGSTKTHKTVASKTSKVVVAKTSTAKSEPKKAKHDK